MTPEPFAQQKAVLAHLADADVTTVGAAAAATALNVYETRAALKALVKRGYAFERLGQESSSPWNEDREVPRGVYVITPDGRRWVWRDWPGRGA